MDLGIIKGYFKAKIEPLILALLSTTITTSTNNIYLTIFNYLLIWYPSYSLYSPVLWFMATVEEK